MDPGTPPGRATSPSDPMYRTIAAWLALAPLALHAAPPSVGADTADVVRANNRFALDLYGELAAREGNLFFSPYSISTALAMTSAGAQGATLRQMAATLHLPPQDKLHPANAALVRRLNGDGKRPYQLRVANALWGQKGYSFLEAFLRVQRQDYAAPLHEVDFRDAGRAAAAINSWVEEQTNKKIKDLVRPDSFDGLTRLVLTNAIYFKGDWAAKFEKKDTRDGTFHVSAAKLVKVPLMSREAKGAGFRYADTKTLQVLEMPYAGEDLSMVVLLPKKEVKLAEVERELPRQLAGWLRSLHEPPPRLAVTVPRFQLKAELSLKTSLSKLGMPLAFNKSADFSGMADDPQGLYVADAVHKAFVEVNEEGSEAAAATGVVMATRSGGPPPEFVADRPFVFLIRDRRSGCLLFLGRLANPAP